MVVQSGTINILMRWLYETRMSRLVNATVTRTVTVAEFAKIAEAVSGLE
jgi:hypothetical protein